MAVPLRMVEESALHCGTVDCKIPSIFKEKSTAIVQRHFKEKNKNLMTDKIQGEKSSMHVPYLL